MFLPPPTCRGFGQKAGVEGWGVWGGGGWGSVNITQRPADAGGGGGSTDGGLEVSG